jgi:hypothetical protein
MPPLSSDQQLDALAEALAALALDRTSADQLAAKLKTDLPERRTRRPFSKQTTVAVFRRDRFTCRYCGSAVVPTPVLRAASLVWPDVIPYQKNWRTDLTHPLYLLRSATVDHVIPHAHDGSHDDLGNLATACWPCNTRKGDLPGWKLLNAPETDWDGFVRFYPTLWQIGEPGASPAEANFHRDWLRALTKR